MLLTLELGDLQLELSDQGLDGALMGQGVGELCLCFIRLASHRRHQRLERFDMVRKGREGGLHDGDGIMFHLLLQGQNARLAPIIRRSAAAIYTAGCASRSPPAGRPAVMGAATPLPPWPTVKRTGPSRAAGHRATYQSHRARRS